MSNDLDTMDRKALELHIRALFVANAKMREEATQRMTKLRETRRFFGVAYDEQRSFMWRHYALCRELFGPPAPTPKPPREIPAELLDAFTMGGRIPVELNYLDATYPGNWPLIYTDIQNREALITINKKIGSEDSSVRDGDVVKISYQSRTTYDGNRDIPT